MGLSFSGGLALVAAADPVYAAAFQFVMAVGAQDDMTRVANYYRTGEDERPNGTVERLAAHPYGPLVLEYEYRAGLCAGAGCSGDPERCCGRHLYEDKGGERLALAALNEPQSGRRRLRLLDASFAGDAGADRGARMPSMRRSWRSCRRMGICEGLKTPVYLLHGEADNIIPAAETLWMASELPREDAEGGADESGDLAYRLWMSSKPTAMDEWRLIHFFALVMQAAEQTSDEENVIG